MSVPDRSERTKSKFLSIVERAGNKIPHTLSLFIGIVVSVFILSFIFSVLNITAVNPVTNETIVSRNLISIDGLVLLLTTFVRNFSNFPILGITLVVGVSMGLCEVTGLFSTMTRVCLSGVKDGYIAFFIALFGLFMCSLDGAVSMIIIPTVAATIYLSKGKNPLIGVFSGFAAAATGAAMEFIPGYWQVVLTPLTVTYARLFDPAFDMVIMSDYFAILVASVMAIFANVFVTVRIIEPMYSSYDMGKLDDKAQIDDEITIEKKKALKSAGISLAVYLGLIGLACIPTNSFFRGPTGSLVIDAPLMSALENLLFLFFLIPGLTYAIKTKQVKNISELADILAKGLNGLLPFIVLAIIIGQFIAFFNASNIGAILAIKGGELISSLSMPIWLTFIVLFVVYSMLNILIISGSTKFLLFAPIVIPMMMQLNIHPAFTQFVLRIADGATNAISPFNYFLPIVITLCNKYEKKTGIGTVLSSLLPYSIANAIVFLVIMLIFVILALPIGIGGATQMLI